MKRSSVQSEHTLSMVFFDLSTNSLVEKTIILDIDQVYLTTEDSIEIHKNQSHQILISWTRSEKQEIHYEPISSTETKKKRHREVTCRGCLEDQPNQLAHMEDGGCLYDPALEDNNF